MRKLGFKDIMRKYKLKDDTMNENNLRRVYTYLIYPKISKIYTHKGFVNSDDGSLVLIGQHLLKKTTNLFSSVRLVVNQINFYQTNYLNL